MKPFHKNQWFTLYNADCLEMLSCMDDCSVDAVVTDPPYGWRFMGKKWDYDIPSVEVWQEVLRVLKPGGHALVASGVRTQHRMAVNIEDAGFEIRDVIAWVYGSGFPKSQDVSKAIDKAAGVEREVVSEDTAVKRMIPGADQNKTGSWVKDNGRVFFPRVTAPATEAARQWEGWGTALKPAREDWTLARKPLQGTVAQNVLEWGTGAVNIDGCRIESDIPRPARSNAESRSGLTGTGGASTYGSYAVRGSVSTGETTQGRFPANFIHDGSVEVTKLFPETSSGKMSQHIQGGQFNAYGKQYPREVETIGDEGSAARFFKCCPFDDEDLENFKRLVYCAKASPAERGKFNNHPTVKPKELMRYFVKMITPPRGLVLDPYIGSGTTALACQELGMQCIGVELENEHCKIIIDRLPKQTQCKLPLGVCL